jgi:hypothetical protein
VHGHPRETGWVVAHVRAPVEAEDDQLALVEVPPPAPDPEDPGPEPSPEGPVR